MLKKMSIIVVFLIMTVRGYGQEENYISMYLLNFTRYIEWPEERRQGDFVIEVLGHESVYEKLKEEVRNKKAGNQPISVRNYFEADEMGKPHIMFVGHWQSHQMPQVVENLENSSTLIIAEKTGMLEKGAAINFLVVNGKIQYEYNKPNALDRGLSVSSRLWQMGISQN